ncbi:DUF960 family protein [Lysinibacillus sp. FSL K6-0057]|uniref:DUF960 family protein n=1 Tax=Lysinibacillus sp. FSL K6-0057 TaxID=2921411 RepID=UPI0031599EA0
MFVPTPYFYMTRAIHEELPEEHQQFILKFLLQHHLQLTDYLQIFEFYIENDEQWLIQRQEQPNRETTIYVQLHNAQPIHRKVWAMNQGSKDVIILFPEDY